MNRRLLLCDSLPFWGGGEHWIVVAARALAVRGWRTTVAGRRGSELLRRAQTAGIDTVAWPYRRDFDFATIRAADRFLQRHAPDLVLVTTGRDIRTVGLAARWRGLPVVWRMGLMPKHTWIHRVTGGWVVTRVIAPSEYVRDGLELFSWLRGKTTVIANGIRTTSVPSPGDVSAVRARLGFGTDEHVVLYVGRLLHAKGVDTLLRAFGSLATSLPDTRCVLVGTGPEEDALRRFVRDNGIDDRVVLAGFTDDPSDYFTACDLLVLPSRFETFGFVLLEAMARAKPVVATRVGGVPEVTGDEAAWLVAADDAAALAEAVGTLLHDPERRRLLGAAGRRRVDALFSESQMVDRIEELFHRVITERGGRDVAPVPLESVSATV